MTSAPEFLKENVVALTKMNWGCSDSKMPLGLPTFYRQKVCWENYSATKAGNFLRKKWGISGGRVKTPYGKVKWPGEEKLELGEGIHTLAERPGLAPGAPWNLTYLWTSHYCVHILLPLAKCEDLLQWSTDFLTMIFISVERSFVLSRSVSTPTGITPEKLNGKSLLPMRIWYRRWVQCIDDLRRWCKNRMLWGSL